MHPRAVRPRPRLTRPSRVLADLLSRCGRQYLSGSSFGLSTRRKEPLLAAQKHAAEAAVAAATPRPSIPHAAPGLPTVAEEAAGPGAAPLTEAALDVAAANAWAVGGTCDPKYWECPGKRLWCCCLPSGHAGPGQGMQAPRAAVSDRQSVASEATEMWLTMCGTVARIPCSVVRYLAASSVLRVSLPAPHLRRGCRVQAAGHHLPHRQEEISCGAAHV